MSARTAAPSSFLAGLLSLLLMAGVLGLLAPHAARADSAPLDPANPATPATVTADPLPTVQINGVAWAQTVVGNTVYVAGEFTRVRPAGAAPGTQEVVRNHLLAYDIRSGELITAFAPRLNAQAVSIAATPDGSRIFVGGDFTSVDGQARNRIAAFDTATGQLVADFRPAFNSQVSALAVTNSAVYAGGWFTAVGTTGRRYVAAVSTSNGALLPWAPQPSGGNIGNAAATVMALTVPSGGQQVVIGGRFGYLNGVQATGVGAVDATTGATRPFAINQLITNQGTDASVFSLTSAGDTVYGTAYTFGAPGNLEGSFAAAANGGAVKWINDCHGDSYSSFPVNGALYMASHAHVCSNIGGFPEQNPQVNMFATALSLTPVGTVGPATLSNQNFTGKPAPALLPWYPTFYSGSYTGQFQAGWSVTGNSQYVVYGGEFPGVNGSDQQGLVRFAVPALAPNKVAPRTTGTWSPSATMIPGAVRISWPAVSDRDNENLTYRVYRDSDTSTPVCQTTGASTWWNLPTYACGDNLATVGAHRYLVRASDPAGNSLDSTWVNATVPASSSSAARKYTEVVRTDGATRYWSLNEKSGTTAYDGAGVLDMSINAGVTRGRPGAISADSDTAFDFNGSTSGFLATRTAQAAPQTFTVESWFQTTSTSGGKIIGFGNQNSGNSTSYDRHVYLNTSGRLLFGVNNGAQRTVTTTKAYNDGAWHHVAASLSSAGMALYVDGELVGSQADVTSALAINGYWRVGGDTSWSGAAYLAGRIDEVAVYASALAPAQVKRHHDLGRGVNAAPTASFTSTSADQTVTVDGSGSADFDGQVKAYAWEFGDGAAGAGPTASHTYAQPGTYTVKLTVTDDDGATGTATGQVTVTAPPVGPGSVAKDTFERTVASGWGAAELGGAWTIGGGLSNATVVGGAGQLTGAAGRTLTALLDGVARRDVAVQTDVVLPEAPTGGGTYISLAGRRVGASDYRATVRVQPTGALLLRIDRLLNDVETVLVSEELPGRYTPGTALNLRLEAQGTAPTTLRAKAWAAGAAEPTWQLTTADSSAALQAPGGLFVETYTSGSATRPQVMRFDNLRAEPAGTVAEPVNAPPTAAFTFTVDELAVAVDGAGSSDPEGAVAGYAWNFGDGSTGTGKTATHAYAQAGSYAVRLTVTDGAGATGTVTQQVTVAKVTPPPAGGPLAADAFGREVTGGFGVADVGGAWQTFGAPADVRVTGGAGRLSAAPKVSSGAWLDVSAQDVVLQADVVLEQAATGGGTFVSFGARNAGATRYNGQLRLTPDGALRLSLVTVVNWNETEKAAITLPGTYTPGTTLTVRLEVTGNGTTTLRAKAWAAGTAEPAWLITATDTTASLQRAGGVETEIYQSGSATTPNTYRLDNLWVGRPGENPPAA